MTDFYYGNTKISVTEEPQQTKAAEAKQRLGNIGITVTTEDGTYLSFSEDITDNGNDITTPGIRALGKVYTKAKNVVRAAAL